MSSQTSSVPNKSGLYKHAYMDTVSSISSMLLAFQNPKFLKCYQKDPCNKYFLGEEGVAKQAVAVPL